MERTTKDLENQIEKAKNYIIENQKKIFDEFSDSDFCYRYYKITPDNLDVFCIYGNIYSNYLDVLQVKIFFKFNYEKGTPEFIKYEINEG